MTMAVVLSGVDEEVFAYDSLEEAIAGAGRLARASLREWEHDGIERVVSIECYYVPEFSEGGFNADD